MGTISIAGGTGAVGNVLVRSLVGQGFRVRVLTRSPRQSKTKCGTSVAEMVGVNFDEPKTLESALKGSDQAFIGTGTSEQQVQNEISLIDAALAVGVPHIVKLSCGGAGSSRPNCMLEWHTEIDAHLITRRNMTSTLIRPAIYMHTILGAAAAFVSKDAWGGAAGDGSVALIDSRDVAAAASLILARGPECHAGKIYDLSGPLPVRMDDVALSIAKLLRSPIRYKRRSPGEQRVLYETFGVAPLSTEVLMGCDDLVRENLFATPTGTFEALTGHVPRSVPDWIREHIGLFTLALNRA